MRVLINAASAKRGGIVTYTRNLVAYMLQRGVGVALAAPPEFECPAPAMHIPVRASEYLPFRRVAWEQLQWRQMVKRHRPDILFSSANFGMFYSPVAQVLLMREGGLFDPIYLSHIAPSQGVRVQATRHSRRRMMLMSAHHAHHVITPSQSMLDSLIQWDPGLAGKSSANHYGARHDLFSGNARHRRWREDGTLRLLYVSVYYPHKCPGVVCTAVDLLDADGVRTHATITMAMDELRHMPGAAHDRLIMKRAHAKGMVTLGQHPYSELPNLYAQHDAFVFPSISETFGHPMVEAMASGLPIIAADTPINREICGDGAIYFEPFSAHGLRDSLKRLDRDEGLRRQITESAKVRVMAEFKWDDHVTRLLEIFERAVSTFGCDSNAARKDASR